MADLDSGAAEVRGLARSLRAVFRWVVVLAVVAALALVVVPAITGAMDRHSDQMEQLSR